MFCYNFHCQLKKKAKKNQMYLFWIKMPKFATSYMDVSVNEKNKVNLKNCVKLLVRVNV